MHELSVWVQYLRAVAMTVQRAQKGSWEYLVTSGHHGTPVQVQALNFGLGNLIGFRTEQVQQMAKMILFLSSELTFLCIF